MQACIKECKDRCKHLSQHLDVIIADTLSKSRIFAIQSIYLHDSDGSEFKARLRDWITCSFRIFYPSLDAGAGCKCGGSWMEYLPFMGQP